MYVAPPYRCKYITIMYCSAWLDEIDDPLVRKVSLLTEGLTSLDMDYAEELQVFDIKLI